MSDINKKVEAEKNNVEKEVKTPCVKASEKTEDGLSQAVGFKNKNSDKKVAHKKIDKNTEDKPLKAEKEFSDNGVKEVKEESIRRFPVMEFEKAVKEGEKLFGGIKTCLENIYEKYFKIAVFGYAIYEVESAFENYLQALLFIHAVRGENCSEKEIEFLYSVLKGADIFNDVENIEDSIKKAENIISKIPVAVMMTVAVDKTHGEENSKILGEMIYSIYKIMCMTDGNKPLKKEEFIDDIISFAKMQGVSV